MAYLGAWTALLLAGSCTSGVTAGQLRPPRPNLCRPGMQGPCILDAFIVVPEHKLLFCYIEKVGCKNFNELFRRLRSRYDPSQMEGHWAARNTPGVHHLTKADLEEMLVSEEWHKAVFWRRPLERFASAWTSKCRGGADEDGQQHCQHQFGEASPYPLPFEETISFLANHDLEEGFENDTRFDRHWVNQHHYCGGLEHTLRHYNTVEELTMDTAHAKVSKMLVQVGVHPQSIEGFDELFPSTEAVAVAEAWKSDAHHTDAGNLSFFYPQGEGWRRQIVTRHYRKDAEVFSESWQPGASLRRVGFENDEFRVRWPLVDFV